MRCRRPLSQSKGQGEKKPRDLVGLQDKLNTQGKDQVSILGGEIRSGRLACLWVFSPSHPLRAWTQLADLAQATCRQGFLCPELGLQHPPAPLSLSDALTCSSCHCWAPLLPGSCTQCLIIMPLGGTSLEVEYYSTALRVLPVLH